VDNVNSHTIASLVPDPEFIGQRSPRSEWIAYSTARSVFDRHSLLDVAGATSAIDPMLVTFSNQYLCSKKSDLIPGWVEIALVNDMEDFWYNMKGSDCVGLCDRKGKLEKPRSFLRRCKNSRHQEMLSHSFSAPLED
jgi:hypothetical protein